MDDSKNDATRLAGEVAALQKEVSNKKSELEDKDRNMAKFGQDVESIKKKLDSRKDEVKAIEAEVEKKSKLVEQLKKEKEDADAAAKEEKKGFKVICLQKVHYTNIFHIRPRLQIWRKLLRCCRMTWNRLTIACAGRRKSWLIPNPYWVGCPF